MSHLPGKILLAFFIFFPVLTNNVNEQRKLETIISQKEGIVNPVLLAEIKKLRLKSKEAKAYCKANHLNIDFYILVDLKLHSGLKRFFICDFKKDTIMHSFLVSHGCYTYPWGHDNSKDDAVVSNEDGSHASSVGKYIITARGHSQWGINVKYYLSGQEKTNSNAAKREIVLHSWDSVSDIEVYPNGTPEGWGCPAISNNSMRIVDQFLKTADKKVLLWVIK
ncbi:MAG: hypothetical protein JWN76_1174 [Chitinophagaceae bacterium]|nr:hypothetical protein [Chitinophagaceae bacterium]